MTTQQHLEVAWTQWRKAVRERARLAILRADAGLMALMNTRVAVQRRRIETLSEARMLELHAGSGRRAC